MLTELKFVQGAVSKKELVPGLTHFLIKDGFVRSFNGTLSLCSPVSLDIDCKPKAEPLIRAISSCPDTIALSMTETGRLRVQSGKFRAFIDCVEGELPHTQPEGDIVRFDGTHLINSLRLLLPFVGNDASRPWCNGILFNGTSAFATNNIILVEHWLGSPMPVVANVPANAIKEMIRIGEPPTHAQMTNNSITFHYEGERWLRSQLLNSEWPDISKILDQPSRCQQINEELFTALEQIEDFSDPMGRVFIRNGVVSTHEDLTTGAYYNLDLPMCDAVFQIKMLNLLQGVAKKIDFTTYPNPCMFFGDRLRGAIIGMRM